MSIKSKLSAAALVGLFAVNVMAATNANAFPQPNAQPGLVGPEFVVTPASTSSRLCDGAVSLKSCGDHLAYLETLRSRRVADTSPGYMKNLDPRTNQSMLNAGGGGGGGGGGGR